MNAKQLSLLLYPNRLKDAFWFSDWQYYYELSKLPCPHLLTRIISANTRTLIIKKQCLYCMEVITIDCKADAA